MAAEMISVYPSPSVAPKYHTPILSEYNRVVLATAGYIATGSSAAFLPTGSVNPILNLTGGGQVTIAATTTVPVEINVASVVSGSGYLFYYNP